MSGLPKNRFRAGCAFVLSVVPPALAHAGDGASRLPAEPMSFDGFLQMALGLMLVLALIVLAAWLLRRFSPLTATAHGALRVIGGISLGQRERVVLMQVGAKQILLGVAPGRVQALCVLDEPLPVTAGAEQAGGFARQLAQRLSRLSTGNSAP
jgi:flagellar protein FliO/FliZ